MKALLMTLPLLLSAVPVNAGLVILPNLFASEYCNLRASGVTHQSALEAAMDSATIEGTPVKVTMEDGRVMDADVIQAAAAITDRCPQYQ